MVAADLHTVTAQRDVYLAHPVDAVVRLVRLPDPLTQRGVRHAAGRGRAGLGRVVAGHRQKPGISAAQDIDDRLGPETILVFVDEADHLGPGRSSSAAKRARRLQDLVGPTQLGILPSQPLELGRLIRRGPRLPAGVNLGLPDPLTQRLAADAELVRHRRDRRPLGVVLRPGLADQAHRPRPEGS
nr:hypothetical protein [Micromonospora sp. WMMC415]